MAIGNEGVVRLTKGQSLAFHGKYGKVAEQRVKVGINRDCAFLFEHTKKPVKVYDCDGVVLLTYEK